MKIELVNKLHNNLILFEETKLINKQQEDWMIYENEVDYDLICLIISRPKYYLKDYKESLENKYGELKINLMKILKRNKLWMLEDKFQFVKHLNYRSKDLERMIEGKEMELRELERLYSCVYNYKSFRPIEAKAILVCLTESLKNKGELKFLGDKLEELLKKSNYLNSRFLLRKLFDILSPKKIEPEKLKQENEDLISTIETLQMEKEEIKEQLEDLKDKSEKETLLTFFKKLNENNKLLDNMAKAELQIKDLKKKNITLNPEIESIPMIITGYMRFIKDMGINPIEEIDNIKSINLREAEQYLYNGTDFHNPHDVKKVIVRSPGWRFENWTISKPEVFEVSDEK